MLRSHRYLGKGFSARGELPPYEVLAREVPLLIQDITTGVGCLPELHGKSLLLKALHFGIAPQSRMKSVSEELPLTILSNYGFCVLHYQHARQQDMSDDAAAA